MCLCDSLHFFNIDPPAPETLMRALELLNYLGALDDEGDLTALGEQMADFPVDPQWAKMLIVSPDYSCSNEILTIVACMSVPQIFMRPIDQAKSADEAKAQFAHPDGDHLTLLNAFQAYEYISEADRKKWCWDNFISERSMISAENIRRQLSGIMQKLDIPLVSNDIKSTSYYPNIRLALTAGMFMQVAFKQSTGKYLTVKDSQQVEIHPSSVVISKPEWVLFEEFALTTKNFIRTVSVTRVDWLVEIAPHYYELDNFPKCEAKDALEIAYKKLANARRMEREKRF